MQNRAKIKKAEDNNEEDNIIFIDFFVLLFPGKSKSGEIHRDSGKTKQRIETA
jgi:hypothetical protein